MRANNISQQSSWNSLFDSTRCGCRTFIVLEFVYAKLNQPAQQSGSSNMPISNELVGQLCCMWSACPVCGQLQRVWLGMLIHASHKCTTLSIRGEIHEVLKITSKKYPKQVNG